MDTGSEYVGGDAYNLMLEVSLKAGYYNTIPIARSPQFRYNGNE